MSVTIRPNAPYHSRYLGAPPCTPVSLKSKSRIRLSAATTTITPLTTLLAVLEAMACARPLVVTSVGSLSKIVEHEHTGLIAPPGDVDAIARATEALLERPAWAAALGRRARRMVEAQHSFDATLAAYRALYRQILGERAFASPASAAVAQ